MNNLDIIKERPKHARLRMEATTPSGRVAIVYNTSHYELLRIALALKATQITMTAVH